MDSQGCGLLEKYMNRFLRSSTPVQKLLVLLASLGDTATRTFWYRSMARIAAAACHALHPLHTTLHHRKHVSHLGIHTHHTSGEGCPLGRLRGPAKNTERLYLPYRGQGECGAGGAMVQEPRTSVLLDGALNRRSD